MIVLIVEDEKNVTKVWKEFIADLGEVRIAYDPEEGLRLMKLFPRPEVVLLDLSFQGCPPERTLLHYLPLFRKLNPEATIIAVTGNTEQKIMLLAQQLGIDFYGRKPEDASSQSSLLHAIKEGARSLTDRQPSYTQPLEVFKLLTQYLHQKTPL